MKLRVRIASFVLACFAFTPLAGAIQGPIYLGPRAIGMSWVEVSNQMIHVLGVDDRFLFVGTLPIPFGSVADINVHNRLTGHEIATLPAPPTGWVFPFMAQCDPDANKLYVWDGNAFPDPTIHQPTLYVYRYGGTHAGNFHAELVQTVDFRGTDYGIGWAADIELLPDGTVATADSIFGAIWLLDPETGGIEMVVGPEQPTSATIPSFFPPLAALPNLPGFIPSKIGEIPYDLGINPGANYLAYRDGYLYFTNAVHQAIERIPTSVFHDGQSTAERAAAIETVSERPAALEYEILAGMTFNQYDEDDPWLYVADPFQERIARVDVESGQRQTVLKNAYLFNAVHAVEFGPPLAGVTPLYAAMDQEHRLDLINGAIEGGDLFLLPWRVAKLLVDPR